MKPTPLPLLLPLCACASLFPFVPAESSPSLPPGYVVVTSISADLDGKPGPEPAYLVLPTSGESVPRLWAYQGGKRALDWAFSRFKTPGSLSAPGTRPKTVLEAQDLTGDGRPELLVRVASRSRKAAHAATYVFGWDGARFRNLVGPEFALTPGLLPVRALAHSAAGGAAVRPDGRRAELVVWDREKPARAGAPAAVVAQFFSWNGQSFVPGRSLRSGKPGKAGLQELGLNEATTAAPKPGQKQASRLFVTRAPQVRPVCDQD